MSPGLTEGNVEQIALGEFQTLDWQITFALDTAPDRPFPERGPATNHSNVVSTRRLCLPDVEKILEEL